MTTTTMHVTSHRIERDFEPRRARGLRRAAYPHSWVAPLLGMAALAITVFAVGAFGLARAGVPSAPTATIGVRVSPCDTLWSIARANPLPGASTAATVEAIAEANGLSGSSITPGMVLRVPASVAVGTAFAQADTDAATR
jgi:LysM domain